MREIFALDLIRVIKQVTANDWNVICELCTSLKPGISLVIG